MPRRQDLALSALLAAWLVLSVITIWLRPLWPIDETRYLGVAWEMWQRKDFIVPYLNGEPYSHKPPMLFWLMHLGWALFGVNEWWPRLISPLLALCTVPVVRRIAWRLWPAEVKRANNSVWILFGGLLFAVGLGLTMFDMLLTLLVATAVLGILQAAQGGRRGLVLLAAGIGFGLLAKGPVVLLHVLPVALLAPWWQPALRQRLTAWYAGIGLAVVGGAIVALAWVIPAIGAGGADYREAILWRANCWPHCRVLCAPATRLFLSAPATPCLVSVVALAQLLARTDKGRADRKPAFFLGVAGACVRWFFAGQR